MTTKEAIDNLEYLISEDCTESQFGFIPEIEMAIEALETIEELEKRGITIDTINEYKIFEDECIRKGFTFKSLLEAREKQIPKKPLDVCTPVVTWGLCPECKGELNKLGGKPNRLLKGTAYCPDCGQALDWSEEE